MKREIPFDPDVLRRMELWEEHAARASAQHLEAPMASAVSTLTPRQVAVMDAKMAHRTNQDIADELGVTPATVASTWDQTKRKLRRALARNPIIREVLSDE